MYKNFSSPTSIGVERAFDTLKAASYSNGSKKPVLERLFKNPLDINNVKQLYIDHHPILTTCLEGKETLVRPLRLPLTKEKDINAALSFQAEPLLPYPIDEAILAHQVISKSDENTDLSLLIVRKESVNSHLEFWRSLQIEPEKISCIPSALCEFGNFYLSEIPSCLILHIQKDEMTCILLEKGKLIASFAQSVGLDLLFEAKVKDGLDQNLQNVTDWQLAADEKTHFGDALSRLQKEVIKIGYALSKENGNVSIEGIALTGDVADCNGLSSYLTQSLPFNLLGCQHSSTFSSQELLSYAVPIGLALGSLPGKTEYVDFRQQELSYPHPWQRLKVPLVAYFATVFLASFAFYFFSQQYLSYQEDQLKQTYLDLLAGMHKSHEQFESAYLAKNPQAYEAFNQTIPEIKQLTQENVLERLDLLHKEIEMTPDSFPLFANIPRVSDVLAWLSKYAEMDHLHEEEPKHHRLQIENFSYAMLKRPQQGKKQEKYQVKIELEFTSPAPKWAREFHDMLIAPNNWVDPKGEVKWNSNRGKYKTSFFLKDKTIYPSS